MSSLEVFGKIKMIFICPKAGEKMIQVTSAKTLKHLGLEGDRYASNVGFWQTLPKPRETIRDVSLINEADIHDSGFTEAETRRNIIVENKIDLTSLIGKKFLISNVLFEGSEECTPCKRPSELSGKPNFAKAFKNTGGLRARVLTDGIIKVGDLIHRPRD